MLGELSGDLLRVKKLSSVDPLCGRHVDSPVKEACLASLWLVFSSARRTPSRRRKVSGVGVYFPALYFLIMVRKEL